MAAGKRRERREAKLREITLDDDGKYSYTGDLWRIAGTDSRRQKMMLTAGVLILFAVVIGSGYLDSRNAMGTFYVVVPYIGEVSALFAIVWNAFKILMPGSDVRTYVLEKAGEAIPVACRILMVFALIGLAFSSVYLLYNGTGGKAAESSAYLLLKAAAAAMAEWYRRLYGSVEWEKI